LAATTASTVAARLADPNGTEEMPAIAGFRCGDETRQRKCQGDQVAKQHRPTPHSSLLENRGGRLIDPTPRSSAWRLIVDRLECDDRGVDDALARVLEADGDARSDRRLDLPDSPIGLARMANPGSWHQPV
jgi:hypothetical protein